MLKKYRCRNLLKQYVLIFLLSGALFFNFACFSKSLPKAEVVEFNVDIAEDATSAVVARMLQTEDKPISEIKFEKGTYHFYPDKGFEKFCYISNHGDLMVNTPFPIFNMENLTIDGQGSTFIFHGVMIPFLIDGSKNINVKNVSIDWAQSFHTQLFGGNWKFRG